MVTDIDGDAAEAVATELGPTAMALAVDVASMDAVEAMTAATRARYGRIDVLVNNAGWDMSGPFVDCDPADWDRIIAINLYGVLHTCKAVLPIMAEQGRGTVVNLALGRRPGRLVGRGRLLRGQGRRHRLHQGDSPARWPATASTSTASAPARPTPRCSPQVGE